MNRSVFTSGINRRVRQSTKSAFRYWLGPLFFFFFCEAIALSGILFFPRLCVRAFVSARVR